MTRFILTLVTVAALGGCLTEDTPTMPCTTSTDCPVTEPYCDPALGGCRGCQTNDHCLDYPATPLCNTDSGQCVECLANAECTDAAASQCNNGSCVPCTENAHCEGIEGKPFCDGGECVASCASDEDCPGTACKPDNTCGDTAIGTLGNCEPCEADGECSGARACVSMNFDGSPHGTFCLPEKSGDCTRPFPGLIDRDSIQNAPGPYCGVVEDLTTCDAYLDFRSKGCSEDQDCGAAELDDGLCRDSGGTGLKCTYQCSGLDDCQSPNACSTEDPRYCCTGSVGAGCSG